MKTYNEIEPHNPNKAILTVSGCVGAVYQHFTDYCVSIARGFKFCEQHNWQCSVYMVGNATYKQQSFPCRCGKAVLSMPADQHQDSTCRVKHHDILRRPTAP